MEMREMSKRFPAAHFVDIHEDPEEEDEGNWSSSGNPKPAPAEESSNGPDWGVNRVRETRPRGGLGRQVSLETGFSVLNGGTKKENRKQAMLRSEKSFGGFGTAQRIAADARKGADFDLFRTRSTIVRHNSKLPTLRKESGAADFEQCNDDRGGGGGESDSINKSVPAGRYFAALKGPELDQVKETEDILLPKDEKWPFLLRFPIGCFGMCLGLSSQAILWRALATSPATKFLHITPLINLTIWILALSVLVAVSITYTLKCIFYLEAVKREYFHPVRVNFFFAPWVACMFMAIGVPPRLAPEERLHPSLWCAFMGPILFLDLKIYGQWLSGGRRRLCKVANPSSHLSVVGNFVGAILAARVGWAEAGKFLWSIGFAHYLVVFVTLYQRLPTNEALPKELHPVYSMFIATPAAASIAWGTVYGEFDGLSRTCYFIALFLYSSLVVRVNFFRGFGFSVAWWSYTFPMTTASIASIKYAEQVSGGVSKGLAVALSFVSSAMVSVLLVSTVLHAVVWRTLFPNDLAIAITGKRLTMKQKNKPLKNIRRWTKQPFSSNGGRRNSPDRNY